MDSSIKNKVKAGVGQNLTNAEMAARFGIGKRTVGRILQTLRTAGFDTSRTYQQVVSTKKVVDPETQFKEDVQKNSLTHKYTHNLQKYNAALKEIDALSDHIETLKEFKGSKFTPVLEFAERHTGYSEAVAVAVASDWHIEEPVKASSVSGLNEFNLDIADYRAENFFINVAKLVRMFQKDTKIDKLILALLGDFISNYLHDELVEVNDLAPVAAAIHAKNMLITGIQYILEKTDVDLHLVCKCGNHGRTTKKNRHATELGNSLEYFIYDSIAGHFSNEGRVSVDINDGYHTYIRVFDTVLRFHHGHMVQYQGGIGGITIPVNKAIAGWNRGKKADIDIFGHFHSRFDGGNFICNGSLIGYNSFAVAIKAAFEKPSQTFFLVDKTHGKTVTTPIFLEN